MGCWIRDLRGCRVRLSIRSRKAAGALCRSGWVELSKLPIGLTTGHGWASGKQGGRGERSETFVRSFVNRGGAVHSTKVR